MRPRGMIRWERVAADMTCYIPALFALPEKSKLRAFDYAAQSPFMQ
jgi:hypothetical protein